MVDRRLVLRWAAPAAFLLVVTALVLVVRSALRSDGSPRTTTAPTVAVSTGAAPTRPAAPAAKRWYLIQSGDTLEAIARHFGTSVDELLRLNPGVEPTALRPGQRIRIG